MEFRSIRDLQHVCSYTALHRAALLAIVPAQLAIFPVAPPGSSQLLARQIALRQSVPARSGFSRPVHSKIPINVRMSDATFSSDLAPGSSLALRPMRSMRHGPWHPRSRLGSSLGSAGRFQKSCTFTAPVVVGSSSPAARPGRLDALRREFKLPLFISVQPRETTSPRHAIVSSDPLCLKRSMHGKRIVQCGCSVQSDGTKCAAVASSPPIRSSRCPGSRRQ